MASDTKTHVEWDSWARDPMIVLVLTVDQVEGIIGALSPGDAAIGELGELLLEARLMERERTGVT